MKINFNGKQTLVIAGSAAMAGAAIFGFGQLANAVKNRKDKTPVEQEPEKESEETESETEK